MTGSRKIKTLEIEFFFQEPITVFVCLFIIPSKVITNLYIRLI